MRMSVSNLAFIGFGCLELSKLPPAVGMEIFYEFGNTYCWEELLGCLRSGGRSGGLSLHGPCLGTNLANRLHTHYLAYYEQIFRDAARWQADFVVVHTNEEYEGAAAGVKSLIYDRLGRIMELAARYNVLVVLENVGLTTKHNLLFDWVEYQQLLRDFPQAGALLDTGHAHINGWQLPEVIETLGARLTACHLHDNDGRNDLHRPIGAGTIRWRDFFDSVRRYAHQSLLVLEYADVSLETVTNSIQQVQNEFFSA